MPKLKRIGNQVVLTTASAAEAGDERAGMRPKRRTIAFTVVDAVFTGIYGLDKSFVYYLLTIQL